MARAIPANLVRLVVERPTHGDLPASRRNRQRARTRWPNEVFRKHYDLDIPQRGEQRVTVFDDRVDVYRSEDIDRLRDVCEVVLLSANETATSHELA
jgi:hypothetical protein